MSKEHSMICKLASSVIDQIAAGEVVERPAHLVKELIENSLDAGANSIEVQFAEGGLYVSVKDNGCGISPEDLSLALSRHATSKISRSSDLFSISTYGFRGEALASIAGVSHLTLRSQSKDSDQAYCIKSQFGKTLKVQATGGEKGTTVTVDRLFENVPARLRFLKSESVEHSAIKSVIIAQALSHPKVSFRVIHKGRLLSFWPVASSYLARAEMILSKPLHHHVSLASPWSLELVLSPPNRTFKTSKKMWFFVNGRFVENKTLYGAVMSAHRNLLMHGEYPIIVLHVSCPPQEVDVNVHPSKTQVRFLSTSRVFRLVQGAVRELLEKAPWLDLLHSEKSDFSSGCSPGFSKKPPPPSAEPVTISTGEPSSEVKTTLRAFDQGFHQENFSLDRPAVSSEKLKTTSSVKSAKNFSKTSDPHQQLTSELLKNNFSALKVLAQAHRTYLITESSHSIVLIDQHAAHERILFEKFMAQLKNLEKQKHLIPLKIELDPAEVSAILSMRESFQSLGIDLKSEKSDAVCVLASPPFIKEEKIASAIQRLAEDHIQHGEEFTVEKVVSDISATFACHCAIRAGQRLSVPEMESLLTQMDEFAFSSFCPHGRPVFVEYPFSRIEREFGRIC